MFCQLVPRELQLHCGLSLFTYTRTLARCNMVSRYLLSQHAQTRSKLSMKPMLCVYALTLCAENACQLQDVHEQVQLTCARGQNLLQVPGQGQCQHCLHCTDADGVYPMVVIVMYVAEVHAVPAILVCCSESIRCLQGKRQTLVHRRKY